MIAQLGDIQFEGLLGFNSFNLKYAERFADMPRITDKASLQHLGSELDLISLVIPIHREGRDIKEVIDLLQLYRTNAEVLPFLNGAGELYGSFVIVSVSIDTKKLAPDGSFISVDISIELKEYFDANEERTEIINLKNNAKALSINKPNLINELNVSNIESLPIAELNQVGVSNAAAAIGQIEKVTQVSAQSESILLRAKVFLDKSIQSFETMKQKLTSSSSSLLASPALILNLNSVLNTAKKVKNAASQGDLTTAINESKNLSSSLLLLDKSMNNINRISILRKPF